MSSVVALATTASRPSRMTNTTAAAAPAIQRRRCDLLGTAAGGGGDGYASVVSSSTNPVCGAATAVLAIARVPAIGAAITTVSASTFDGCPASAPASASTNSADEAQRAAGSLARPLLRTASASGDSAGLRELAVGG